MTHPGTDRVTRRTTEEAVADQMDCDLDNFVRRAYAQAGRSSDPKHWEKIAVLLDGVRVSVRQRMHPDDRAATQ